MRSAFGRVMLKCFLKLERIVKRLRILFPFLSIGNWDNIPINIMTLTEYAMRLPLRRWYRIPATIVQLRRRNKEPYLESPDINHLQYFGLLDLFANRKPAIENRKSVV